MTAPLQWTALHDKVRVFINQQQNYEECKTFIDVLSKYVNDDTGNSLDAFNVGCEGGFNLLYYAFRKQNLPVTKLLLEAGADPCIANMNGANLLHIIAATYIWHGDNIREFPDLELNNHLLDLYASMKDSVKRSAFVNAADIGGITPLMVAANVGSFDMTVWLLDNGAEVNVIANGGWTTAAHEATRKGHKDVLSLLLMHGADPDIKTNYTAASSNFRELVCVKVGDVTNGNKDIIDLLDSIFSAGVIRAHCK